MRLTEFAASSRCARELLLATCVTWGAILIALFAVIYFVLTQDGPSGSDAAAGAAEDHAVLAVSGDKS